MFQRGVANWAKTGGWLPKLPEVAHHRGWLISTWALHELTAGAAKPVSCAASVLKLESVSQAFPRKHCLVSCKAHICHSHIWCAHKRHYWTRLCTGPVGKPGILVGLPAWESDTNFLALVACAGWSGRRLRTTATPELHNYRPAHTRAQSIHYTSLIYRADELWISFSALADTNFYD